MTSEEKIFFKQKIKSECEEIIQQRISASEQAMKQAQESANSDEKSSAGDKHETGRAMGQIDSEMNARQLDEARKELEIIRAIKIEFIHQKIGSGSVVLCGNFIFFIALGLGTAVVDEKKIFLLSVNAPIAKLIFQKKIGEKFLMNGNEMVIDDVY